MAFSRYTLTVLDQSLESSTCAVRGPVLTSGNIDATKALFDAFATAVAGVSEGGQIRKLTVAETERISTSGGGNRENKWLVSMRDTEGNPVTMEVPCADPALQIPGSDLLDITTGVGLALAEAIEDIHLSSHGESVYVDSVRFVGRNL